MDEKELVLANVIREPKSRSLSGSYMGDENKVKNINLTNLNSEITDDKLKINVAKSIFALQKHDVVTFLETARTDLKPQYEDKEEN